jgi:enoyl-CoA hydratase/carnithine racemase
MGLVNQVVPEGEDVYAAARAWAARYVGGPAMAYAAAKQVIDRGLEVDLATGLEIERMAFASLFATEDQKVGMRAFVNKEKPTFTGR